MLADDQVFRIHYSVFEAKLLARRRAMTIVVVGGQSRKVGKTSVVAGLIAAMPERRWTAFKISHRHQSQASSAMDEERNPRADTDSSRFLAAGAARSFWVRTDALAEVMPRIHEQLRHTENAIFESNRILEFLAADLYLCVMNPANEDCKDSLRTYLPRADAILVPENLMSGNRISRLEGVRILPMRPPTYVTAEVSEFAREWLTREDGLRD